MSEVLRPTPHVVNDMPTIDFDAQTFADLLRAEGLQDHQIHSLNVHFKKDILPEGVKNRFYKSKAQYDPNIPEIRLSVFEHSSEEQLNRFLLHEAKHAVDVPLGISKEKSDRRIIFEEATYVLGMITLGMTGLNLIPLIKSNYFLNSLAILIVGLVSVENARTAQYRISKDERRARKFERKMMKDPKFNSMITSKEARAG